MKHTLAHTHSIWKMRERAFPPQSFSSSSSVFCCAEIACNSIYVMNFPIHKSRERKLPLAGFNPPPLSIKHKSRCIDVHTHLHPIQSRCDVIYVMARMRHGLLDSRRSCRRHRLYNGPSGCGERCLTGSKPWLFLASWGLLAT